jgi:hypothetical protein
MAQIDVTELLLDPDFVDPIQVIRRATTVNQYGENVLVETTINTYGSVQPANFKELQRLPESLQAHDVRSFYLNLEIVQDASTAYPDVLVFKGKRYQVQTAAPWLNFGAGWNQGVCVGEVPA